MNETADPHPLAAANAPYAHPTRSCDVVMKGGITSGVVYPLAVGELAKVFRFRSIGGTSAGAIAAAATAAAEQGRQTGQGLGFTGLVDLPRRLTEVLPDGRSRLFSLFQPSPETAPAFAVLLAALRAKGKGAKLAAVVGEVLQSYPEGAWLGALPGLLPAVALAFTLAGPHGPLGRLGLGLALLSAVLVATVGALLGSAAVLATRAAAALPENAYGLCRGYAFERSDPHAAGPPPLTEWLADLLDELAGKDPAQEPLTFGDLARAGLPADADPAIDPAIRLEMMTTCLSLGRPYRIPFERVFHFKPTELARFFPPRVIKWMIKHAHPDQRRRLVHEGEPLFALPDTADLPVVFAARLSLSFPLLISAVPLYAAVEFAPAGSGEESEPEAVPAVSAVPAGEPIEAARCWFSDGGLTSNLPIHFFDAPIPAWPTVAVDLLEGTPSADPPERNVWLPETNKAGVLEGWQRFDEGSGAAQLVRFVSALLRVMQNWRDQTLSRLPGQRDRIAHVILGPDEGGMNLAMPPELIATLTERGRIAGTKLRHRFAEPPAPGELSWDNHRWVRYREAMAAIEDLLVALARVYDQPAPPGERTYAELIRRDRETPPSSYRTANQKQRERLAEVTEKLAELGRELARIAGTREDFHEGEPHPPGELRVRPRI
ncbi:MAG TPA: SuhR protein [Thermoanaerobaculia bacterium]|nr:SuhR protein [Thermoanaerobaculia bacterium]